MTKKTLEEHAGKSLADVQALQLHDKSVGGRWL